MRLRHPATALFSLLLVLSTSENCSLFQPKKKPANAIRKVQVISQEDLRQAEVHYNRGLNSYLNQDLDGAIAEWQKTLKLNPKHPKAKSGIQEARATQQKLRRMRP